MDVGCCSSTLLFISGVVPWRVCRLIDNPWSLTEAAPCRTIRLRCCASCCCGARYKSKEKTFPSLIQTGESSSLHLNLGSCPSISGPPHHLSFVRHGGSAGNGKGIQGPSHQCLRKNVSLKPFNFFGGCVLQRQAKQSKGKDKPRQAKSSSPQVQM